MAKSDAEARPAARSPSGLSFTGTVDTSRSRHDDLAVQAAACLDQGRVDEAHRLYKNILMENDKDYFALHGMGIVAREKGRLDVAIGFMKKALEYGPRNPMIATNLGTIYESMEDYEEALVWYKNALKWGGKKLRERGEHGVVLNNLGSVLSKLGRRTESLLYLRRAVDNVDDHPEPMFNLATLLADLGDFRQANHYFRKALELDPENAQAHHNFGQMLLRQGMWEEGWYHVEWRMVATNKGVPWREFSQPLWNGNPFQGARLFVFAEQGIGDELRFVSMLPEAISRGGEVVAECEPRLVSLFQRSFPQVRVVPKPYLPAEKGIEPFDIVCPFGSLGRLFRQDRDAFPVHSGYLKPESRLVEEFRARLAEAGPGPYVGLCWRSGLAGAYRTEYYSTIEDMEVLLKVKGATFVNLQYDARSEELDYARDKFGVDLVRWDDVDLKLDLERAAALTSCLDLVVSPATSVSTMAGALGVETAEFRPFPIPATYFKNGRCPWFPSVRYFSKRQSEKWSKVLRQIAGEIEALKGKFSGRS